jgi:hypothetical protein
LSWIGAVVQGVLGGVQMGIAMDELSKLPSAKTFSSATDLETATSMARRAAQQGMTPQERAAAEQAIGTAQSRTQRAMEQRGLGNLAAAVSQIRTTEALNQLEAQNQAIKRQSLGQYASLAGQMQSIQNQNIQSFNQMLYQQQVALGQAAKAGFSNLTMGLGESIASAVEGQDKVDKAAMGGSPVTMAQRGLTDTTAFQEQNLSSLGMPQDAGYNVSSSDIMSQELGSFGGRGDTGITDVAYAAGAGSSPFMAQEQIPVQNLFPSEISTTNMRGNLSTSNLLSQSFQDQPIEYMTSDEFFTK